MLHPPRQLSTAPTCLQGCELRRECCRDHLVHLEVVRRRRCNRRAARALHLSSGAEHVEAAYGQPRLHLRQGGSASSWRSMGEGGGGGRRISWRHLVPRAAHRPRPVALVHGGAQEGCAVRDEQQRLGGKSGPGSAKASTRRRHLCRIRPRAASSLGLPQQLYLGWPVMGPHSQTEQQRLV